jgi:hypothetical protein
MSVTVGASIDTSVVFVIMFSHSAGRLIAADCLMAIDVSFLLFLP